MAEWTSAFINDLPDSSFLYVAPGGKKDSDGKTTPRSLRFFPYKDSTGQVDLPHLRNALARIPQSSLSASLKDTLTQKGQKLLAAQQPSRSARIEFRARPLGYELRDEAGSDMPTLVGHVAVFNEWAEISSVMEGRFLERIDAGAFTKTINESQDSMRCLFQHGQDPQIGEKPLGPIRSLEADQHALHYEVPLLDTSYNRDIVEMLRADPPVLGSSMRFKVTRDSVDRRPVRSDYNPRRLPERTIRELRMHEFGPVTFPAYQGAKAGLRSITDRMMLGPAVRMDTEDLGILAQMIVLAQAYIEEQDDPGDEANIPKMQDVIATLQALTNYEAQEDEPAEDEEASSAGRHAPLVDAAPVGTSTGTPRSLSWQHVASLDALRVPKEAVDRWSRTT